MLRRSLAALLFVLALAACGGTTETSSPAATSSAAAAAAVLVTADCGADVVKPKSVVDAGQTAMRALDRVAKIETDSAGKFVTAIEGVEQDEGKKLAWLYYVNGKAADKGASEIKLKPGDVEWWDLHNWEKECASVPADAQ